MADHSRRTLLRATAVSVLPLSLLVGASTQAPRDSQSTVSTPTNGTSTTTESTTNGTATIDEGTSTPGTDTETPETATETPASETDPNATEPTTDALAERENTRLDFEIDDDGNVEFEYAHLDFETDGGHVDFTVTHPAIDVDFETDDDSIQFELAVDSVTLEFEFHEERGLEFEATDDGRDVDAEEDSIDYRGDVIDFEWSIAFGIDLSEPVDLEWEPGEFEWVGPDLALEWEADGNDFEVERR